MYGFCVCNVRDVSMYVSYVCMCVWYVCVCMYVINDMFVVVCVICMYVILCCVCRLCMYAWYASMHVIYVFMYVKCACSAMYKCMLRMYAMLSSAFGLWCYVCLLWYVCYDVQRVRVMYVY